MAKTVAELVENIFRESRPPADITSQSEATVRKYILQHLSAVGRGAVIVTSLSDDRFISDMGLSGEDAKPFIERVNAKLTKIHRSDIPQELG